MMPIRRKFSLLTLLGVILVFCLLTYKLIAEIRDFNDTTQHTCDTHTSTTRNMADRRQETVDWLKLFSFLPYGIADCSKLFPRNTTLPRDFKEGFDKFNELVATFKVTEGHVGNYHEEILLFIKLVQAPFVRTVCETGFNAGHSTFIWLHANHKTHVYSFDIGTHEYSKKIAEHIKKSFPGRFNITWGDSTKTIPRFRQLYPNVMCDLIIIDGGHTTEVASADFYNFKSMASYNNLVVLDNYPDKRWGFLKKLGRVWESGKQKAEISEIFHCGYKGSNGFSVARYALGY